MLKKKDIKNALFRTLENMEDMPLLTATSTKAKIRKRINKIAKILVKAEKNIREKQLEIEKKIELKS